MINKKMEELGTKKSTIRELFEYGKLLAEERGSENVYDYSLGNPSVAPPKEISEAISYLLENSKSSELHGYTSAIGDKEARVAIANEIKTKFNFPADHSLIYICTGAAGALTSVIRAITNDGEKIAVFAPYFPEYKVFAESNGSSLKIINCKEPDFRPDIELFEKEIDETIAAVIINSPNNPTGAVYTKEDISAISEILKKKSLEFGHPIYIISDEPYRELAYDGVEVPFIPSYYDNTIICYSYSKSLSIPGERIGYIFVSPNTDDAPLVYSAICGASRSLGFVCAPSLWQKMIPLVIGKTSDIHIYDENRKILTDALSLYGFEMAKPKGAFYLFLKVPGDNAYAFSEAAKKYGLLLVPSDDFGYPGYVRIAYCQNTDMIKRSLPCFKKLAEEFKNTNKDLKNERS